MLFAVSFLPPPLNAFVEILIFELVGWNKCIMRDILFNFTVQGVIGRVLILVLRYIHNRPTWKCGVW